MTATPITPPPSLMPLLLLTLLVGLVGGWSLSALVYPGNGFSAAPPVQRVEAQVIARP